MRNMVWDIKNLEEIGCYRLRNIPGNITLYYDKIEIDRFGTSYELFVKGDMVAMLYMATNRIKNFSEFHAPDKIGGTDEGSEGSGSGPSEAVNEPES